MHEYIFYKKQRISWPREFFPTSQWDLHDCFGNKIGKLSGWKKQKKKKKHVEWIDHGSSCAFPLTPEEVIDELGRTLRKLDSVL